MRSQKSLKSSNQNFTICARILVMYSLHTDVLLALPCSVSFQWEESNIVYLKFHVREDNINKRYNILTQSFVFYYNGIFTLERISKSQ